MKEMGRDLQQVPKPTEALSLAAIEDLRKKGYNQTEIAKMYGVSRQAVSWHKKTYGGFLTTRQIVDSD